jgi:hypothetical protein
VVTIGVGEIKVIKETDRMGPEVVHCIQYRRVWKGGNKIV